PSYPAIIGKISRIVAQPYGISQTEVLMKQTPGPPHLHNGKLLTFYRRKNDADWLCQGVNK
ncbi:hypothetical protein, partial [Pantoea allii]|uniref:hypothetical protein n=1 Tax=Pantoea allii TaxID=574096 RepID=UPI003D315919